MFGGVGLYHADLFFGIIARDVLYLKVDDVNRPDYEAAGRCRSRSWKAPRTWRAGQRKQSPSRDAPPKVASYAHESAGAEISGQDQAAVTFGATARGLFAISIFP